MKGHIAKVDAALALQQKIHLFKRAFVSSMESTVGSGYTFLQECCTLSKQESTLSNINTCFNECATLLTKILQGLKGPLTVRMHAVAIKNEIQSCKTAYYIFLQECYDS